MKRLAKAVEGQPAPKDYDMDAAPRRDRALKEMRRIKDADKRIAVVSKAMGLKRTGRGEPAADRFISTPIGEVRLTAAVAEYIARKVDGHRECFANRIVPTLEAPEEIWMTLYDNGEYRQHYLKWWDDDKASFSIVIEDGRGSLLYNAIPKVRETYVEKRRTGALLYKRGKKREEGE